MKFDIIYYVKQKSHPYVTEMLNVSNSINHDLLGFLSNLGMLKWSLKKEEENNPLELFTATITINETTTVENVFSTIQKLDTKFAEQFNIPLEDIFIKLKQHES